MYTSPVEKPPTFSPYKKEYEQVPNYLRLLLIYIYIDINTGINMVVHCVIIITEAAGSQSCNRCSQQRGQGHAPVDA